MHLKLYELDVEPTERTMILKEASQAEINLQAKHLLQSIPMELHVLFSTDIDNIKSATPIKRTIDNTLPLPSIHEYPLISDALSGIRPMIQDSFKGAL